MKYTPSSLYALAIPQMEQKLHQAVRNGLADGPGFSKVFFRADDIGVPSLLFERMTTLFKRYELPLCLAVVPTWLTRKRYLELKAVTENSQLFLWHQHGWLHRNHEKKGKKQEFGPARTRDELSSDILNGKQRLQRILGDRFYPVFTPPWNRCSQTTLEILSEYGFHGVSRSSGASPQVIPPFADYQVNIDLHTRKEQDPRQSFENLCNEIQLALSSQRAGIMLHHQRMNSNALLLLESLLRILSQTKSLKEVTFTGL